mmetsp:Transcript_12891/g.16291  ORF Transcript_12891/g.16291 Transcript_12891/m.16291 type:complete len:82 (+) Transcript_12891:168-413(+)
MGIRSQDFRGRRNTNDNTVSVHHRSVSFTLPVDLVLLPFRHRSVVTTFDCYFRSGEKKENHTHRGVANDNEQQSSATRSIN